jgi:hypothetical protein
MKPPRKPIPPPPQPLPWKLPHLEEHEISAIKAMAHDHPVAIDIICEVICREKQLSFMVGGEDGRRASDFTEGLRCVGRQLRHFIRMQMPGPTAPVDTGPHAIPRGPPPED